MKSNQNETNDVKDVVVTPEGNAVEVVEKEGFGKKALGFVKKHGKKIVVGAGLVTATVVGYLLGSKKGSNSGDLEFIDLDAVCSDEDDVDVDVSEDSEE